MISSEQLGELVSNFDELQVSDSTICAHHRRLYLSIEFLDGLLSILLDSEYVPTRVRKDLARIIKYQCPDREELIELLSKPIGELRYINKKTRLPIIAILQSFRAIIRDLNSRHKGMFFNLEGTLKREFVSFLNAHIANISAISFIYVVNYSPVTEEGAVLVYTTTQLELKKQTEMNRLIDEYGAGSGEKISMDWKERGQRLDGNFQFGDPFSSQYCAPLNTSYKFEVAQLNSFEGRGTAGGLVTVSPLVGGKVTGTITAVLTVAHVAYGWLTDAHKNGDKDKLSLFSNSCLFASYSRDEPKPYLDYAIVPVTERFRLECDALMVPIDRPTLNGKRFGRLNDAKSFWRSGYANYEGNTVHKRGIATQETEGILADDSIDTQGHSLVIENNKRRSCKCFAIPGDSGAIVFLEEDDLLYPIGLHYSSDSTDVHFTIPLQSILQDYCEKHCIEGLDLTFENPKLVGTLRFEARRTTVPLKQEESGVLTEPAGKGNPKLSIPHDLNAFETVFGFAEEEEEVGGLGDDRKLV